MYNYKHKVRYYETDKMGITHHSNYIRFMEEARVEWMNSIGWSYQKCEDLGMVSPVIAIKCEYKANTTFDDIINIKVKLKEYSGLRLIIKYEMTNQDRVVAIAETEHCFLNKKGIPVRIKREYPHLDELLKNELKM